MTVAVRCPHCSKAHDVPERSLGEPATCQGCGRQFTLTASHDETVAYVKGQATESDGAGKHPSATRTRIGRYEIRERLGAGVFGAVYRAYDAVLDRDVALKMPHPAALDSAEARERFLREARAAGKLRHPHIVPVYDCGQDGDEVFIVAAFIEGKTLAAALAAGQVDRRRAVSIAAKLAHALGTAHQAGIVHRDVKPANVMLDERGEPQLTDFGLAQLGFTSHLTQQGMVLGTPAYMSPEQALGDQSQVGPASDQYSLGVLLYEMLCGRIPFEGPPLTVLYRVREEAPAPPRSIDPTIPPALEATCLKAMAKLPSDRFADCAELSDALRQLDLKAPRAEKPPESAPAAVVRVPFETPAKSRETAREPVRPTPEATLRPAVDSGAFDPYHKWLAIPLAERPPTHYQMLGVSPSESDPDVINTAALQRSAYVRNFQSGKHGEQANRILNEISAALACLLDPVKRAAYDAGLRKARPRAAESKAATRSAGGAAPAAAAATIAPQMPLDLGLLAAAAAEPLAAPAWMLPPPRRRAGLPWWGVASAVGGVAVLVLVAMIALSGGDPPPTDAGDSQPAVEPEGASSSAAVAQGDAAQSGSAPDAAATNPQPEATSSAPPPPTTVAAIETDDLDGQQGSGSPDQPVIATNAIGMTLVLIPAGEFEMGSPAGEPGRQEDETLHRVRLTKDFYLGRHEVTVGQFRQFVDDTGYKTDAERTGQGGRGFNAAKGDLELGVQYTWQNPGWSQTDDHPVLNVSWNDAQEFLKWLTRGRPRPYRLPTEAEWEYACRAGTRTTYATGNDPESLVAAANIPDASAKVRFPSWKTVGGTDGHVFTAPVGSLQPNGFGLADMHGNVGEWCADWYGAYPTNAVVDPTGPATGIRRVLRGGGWSNASPFCRSACRSQDLDIPGRRFNYHGFRVARDTDPGSATTTLVDLGPPAAAAQAPWPADAVEFEGHRYKVFYEQLSWSQAQAKCQEMGGHLPIVTSQPENAFLMQLFRSGLPNPQNLDGLWLGATDEAKEGTWLWVDGTPLTYENWAQGQPNNKQASEHFLYLWVGRGSEWADRPNASTDYRTFYACEWDAPASGDVAATSLFNGRDLTGWDGDPSQWKVEDGAIVGQKPAGGQRDTYLATQASYGDFVFTAKFRLHQGNSGIVFRGELLPDGRMTGYVTDLGYADDFKYMGWLFLVGTQGPRATPDATPRQRMLDSLDVDGWNEYRITAIGNRIVLEINGVEVVNTRHDGPARGRIGLQLYGGTIATTIEFKDIEIRELPGAIAEEAPAAPPQLARLDELNTSGWDAFAWVSADGGSIYWEASPTRAPAGMQIWHAERPSPSSPFDNKRALFQGRQPALTPDEKQIVFVRPEANGQERLYTASRPSRSDTFGTPQEMTQFAGYVGYNNPWISPDGLRLHVNAVSANNSHRYLVSTREKLADAWPTPGLLAVRWNVAEQGVPISWLALSPDQLSLLATHEGTIGQWRVVRFRRATTGDPFADYEYLTLSGIGQVSGEAPRFVAATRELHLTLKPSGPGSRPNDPADLAVIRNVDVEAVEGSAAGPTPLVVDQPANPSTPDDENGFRSLFNGTDLTGWRVIGGPREGWVRGGVLVSDGAEGNLATEAEYSDFELSLEFRIGRNANSGIFLRAADVDKTAQDCAEVQIYDDSTATDVKPDQGTGSIYSFVAASPPNSVPPGQWQTMVIRMQGTTVRVTLDDTVRVNADLNRHRDRLKGYVNRRRGYIKLQHHAGRVEFRNIRIRELP